ncbi:MAG: hypothetical protein K2J71_04990 [Oscillospiraceae bacterium]|nr:hypothetical protein [Oscillospiraceae bacterium]
MFIHPFWKISNLIIYQKTEFVNRLGNKTCFLKKFCKNTCIIALTMIQVFIFFYLPDNYQLFFSMTARALFQSSIIRNPGACPACDARSCPDSERCRLQNQFLQS